jgi:hypothetical protein
LLGAVKQAQDLDFLRVFIDAIDDDEGRLRDNEFTCPGLTSRASSTRMFTEDRSVAKDKITLRQCRAGILF